MTRHADQCSRCDDIWTLVNTGERRLEEISQAMGVPTPSLARHLSDHGDGADNLMKLVTYAGTPLRRDATAPGLVPVPAPPRLAVVDDPPATTTEDPEPEPEPVDDPAPAADPGDQDHTDDTPQRGFVPVDHVSISRISTLAQKHPSEGVRDAATELLAAIEEHENTIVDRIRLEQLVTQRDQLTHEIDELAQRLGLAATPTPAPSSPDMADVRRWALDNGWKVGDKGKLPTAVVDAYTAAHQDVS